MVDFLYYLMKNEQKWEIETFVNQPMLPLTNLDRWRYEKTNKCPTCKHAFDDENHMKVHDHDHFTGA